MLDFSVLIIIFALLNSKRPLFKGIRYLLIIFALNQVYNDFKAYQFSHVFRNLIAIIVVLSPSIISFFHRYNFKRRESYGKNFEK